MAPVVDVSELTDGVALGSDGIWRATTESEVSYPASGHSACLGVEEGSFWFNHRNDCIRALLAGFPPTVGKPVLDVGGGNGYVSLGLARSGVEVILVEPGESGARNAKLRGLHHVICATTRTAGVRPGSVGAIGLFDVVEHIEDDHRFLAEMCSLLAKGDRIYATVPAYQALWSADDQQAGHHRRYTADKITSLFEATGFAIDYVSYFFRPLPGAVLLFRTLPHRLRSGLTRPNTSIDGRGVSGPHRASSTARSHAANASSFSQALRRLLRPEVTNIERRTPMRFGSSIILAAHRR